MNTEHQDLIQEVIAMAAQGAPKDEIVSKARKAKEAIINEVAVLQRAVNILDGMVPFIAPDVEWEMGWVAPPEPSRFSSSRVVDRRTRILAIAHVMASESETVKTEDIAQQLYNEGDTSSSVKGLATAVGNVLTRTGAWSRLGSGVYKPVEKEVAGIQ